MNEQTIQYMGIADIVSSENILSIQAEPEENRELLKSVLFQRLAELKANQEVVKQVKQAFKMLDRADRQLADEYTRQNAIRNAKIPLKFDGKGRPLNTIENFLMVFRNDEMFSGIKFNELSYRYEIEENGKPREWTNTDDARTREHIESKYKIHSKDKCDDAMRIAFDEHRYHPVKQLIDSIEWDGVPRLSTLFIKWLKCEDTEYTREVTRLVFAGGIHRIYNAGCKFDDVCVLVGTAQGEGKSTFVRWLAMNDKFFTEVKSIETRDDKEMLQGKWICEIAELMAVTKKKDVESVKAFITTQTDRYRMSYDKRAEDYPRQCVFIGTTNKVQFLTDKTGNRRWYPLNVHSSGYELFDHEAEVKEDIRQCWAEAKALYDAGKLEPCANRDLLEIIKKAQSSAVEEDYRVGMIEDYLRNKSKICVIELWKEALDNPLTKPTRRDSNDICLILQQIGGWERAEKAERSDKYGIQKFWYNKNFDKQLVSDLPEIEDLF